MVIVNEKFEVINGAIMSKKVQKIGAPTGNKNGIKLKDPNIRQLAYLQYCSHLARGKSKKSWYFEHPEFRCTWETLEKYLNDEVEFDPLHKKIAEVKGFAYWEEVVEDSAIGKNQNANTASLQMLMRNKYAWDKQTGKEFPLVDNEYSKKFDDLMDLFKNMQNIAP